MARGLKFWIQDVDEFYLVANKGTDQLRSYRAADLHLVFANAKSRFSHDATQSLFYICSNVQSFKGPLTRHCCSVRGEETQAKALGNQATLSSGLEIWPFYENVSTSLLPLSLIQEE